MKTLVTLTAGLALALLLQPGMARAGTIVGSAHDFTDNYVGGDVNATGTTENANSNPAAWNNKRKEICRVCHVPHDHGAVRYGNQGLLWNHEVTNKTSWTMYGQASGQINFIDGTLDSEPTGTSKLCLGCHDGVNAINQYDGKTPADPGYGNGTSYTMAAIDEGYVIGNTSASLSNNHPISITYDNTADDGLNDPTTATMASGETVSDLLEGGKLQCATCHDVHNVDSVAGTHLLREVTKGDDITGANASKLCLVCHNK